MLVLRAIEGIAILVVYVAVMLAFMGGVGAVVCKLAPLGAKTPAR